MTIKKTFCDHCGKQIDSMTDYTEMGISCFKKYKQTDLCVKCFDEMWNTINIFCGQAKLKGGVNDGSN